MEDFHTKPEPRQYNLTNDIEGIEGGLVEYEDDPWEYVKTVSLLEKIIKMGMEYADAHPKTFECARFTYRTIMELTIIFLFIAYFVLIALL